MDNLAITSITSITSIYCTYGSGGDFVTSNLDRMLPIVLVSRSEKRVGARVSKIKSVKPLVDDVVRVLGFE